MEENKNKEREIAGKLFGKVKKIKADGSYIPDKEELKKPFEAPASVVYCFCSGCGSLYELDAEEADIFSREAGLSGRQDFTGKYFEAKGCGICDSCDTAAELKAI